MTVVGTRPEIIKLRQVMKEIEKFADHTIVHTGQNYDYELNELFFEQLDHTQHFLEGSSMEKEHHVGKQLFYQNPGQQGAY